MLNVKSVSGLLLGLFLVIPLAACEEPEVAGDDSSGVSPEPQSQQATAAPENDGACACGDGCKCGCADGEACDCGRAAAGGGHCGMAGAGDCGCGCGGDPAKCNCAGKMGAGDGACGCAGKMGAGDGE